MKRLLFTDNKEEDDVDTSDGSEEEDEDEEEEEPVEETVRPQPPPPPPQQQQQDQPPPRPHENNQITTVRLQPPQHRLFEASNFLGHNLVGPSRNGAIHATLSDPEVLDCPICCEPLTIPVFQCENGHTACSSCCRKLQHKCPSCAMPIGYNRCRAIEKVLESLKIPCSNRSYGCKESICYSKKYEHDRSCSHAPCTCPLPACNFQGSSRVDHKFHVLQEDKEGVLFILNNRLECLGNMITISCMGPSSSKLGYFYELTTKAEGSNVRFQSSTRNIQTRVDHPPSMGFLLVPTDFIALSNEEKNDEQKLLASKCFFSIYGAVSRGKDVPEGRYNSDKISLADETTKSKYLECSRIL
ncbi:E3 UBIQUITIN-PROTEIN LIGASE SINA-LIKE 4 [Salix purpurea]|uniref:RING-type E3 ubiquitin transferase n=1 Tax=Salix purpurea TaxID=77065 RepID=A0A9Q0UT44_SALPP|nr:E3 UBIQUITIN-PROTEIN LIGASE SINA-LIKE 4 [Salix purpurea]